MKPNVQTSVTFTGRHHRASGPGRLQGRLRLGGRVLPRQSRGGQVQVAAQEGGGGGAAGCTPAGAVFAELRRNVGRVPLVRYVWINIISLGLQTDFANCASAGAAGLEGVLSHRAIPRLPTFALHRDQLLRWFLPEPHLSHYLWLR